MSYADVIPIWGLVEFVKYAVFSSRFFIPFFFFFGICFVGDEKVFFPTWDLFYFLTHAIVVKALDLVLSVFV